MNRLASANYLNVQWEQDELRRFGIDPAELSKQMLDRVRVSKAAGNSSPLLDEAEKQFAAAFECNHCHRFGTKCAEGCIDA